MSKETPKKKKPGIEIFDARLLRFPPFTPHSFSKQKAISSFV